MSMPGFDYHFACSRCDAKSHSYPCFVFSHLGYGWLRLPAWSLEYRCWSDISLDLSLALRQALEGDRKKLIAFAESLSSESMTVGAVFTHFGDESREVEIEVIPEPFCPQCGHLCQIVFGEDCPRQEVSNVGLIFNSKMDFDSALVDDYEFSIRTRNILWSLGIRKLGHISAAMEEIQAHAQSGKTTLKEIQKCVAKRP